MSKKMIPSTITELIASIKPTDKNSANAAQEYHNTLTKPQGSLGMLENVALQLAGIQKTSSKLQALPARMYTIAGDHGIADEGVSKFPQEVTRQMLTNCLNGGAAISVLCKHNNIDAFVVDAGCKGNKFPAHPQFIDARIANGTKNMMREAAMSAEECEKALLLGVSLAKQAKDAGCVAVGTGELGIGNTTPSTALFCAFLGLNPQDITGRGAGLDDAGVVHKAECIQNSLDLHLPQLANSTDISGASDTAVEKAFATLSRLGGLEIATLTGLILGAGKHSLLVVIDGFISTAAYVAAQALAPVVKEYCLFSHASAEQGHIKILEKLDIKPLISLDFRLGEGTGAAVALGLVQQACAIYNTMATFSSANVSTAPK